MKRTFKILGLIVLGVFGVFILLVFIFFLKLPSPTEIGQSLMRPSSSSSAATAPDATVARLESDQPETEETTAGQDSAGPEQTENKANLSVKSEKDLEALLDLTDPEVPKSQVCEQLGSVDLIPENFKYDKKTFTENFRQTLFNERQDKDPLLLGMVAPIRHFLQQPKMRELIQVIAIAEKSGQEFSLTEKAGFYAKLVGVYQEMMDSKNTAEHLMDRGYHLMMLTRALKKNPSLVSDYQVHEYCKKVEQAANIGAPMDWQAEKDEFQAMMQSLNVDPGDIGYNTNYKTQLQVNQSEKGVHFQGGWIDDLLPNEDINIGNTKPDNP